MKEKVIAFGNAKVRRAGKQDKRSVCRRHYGVVEKFVLWCGSFNFAQRICCFERTCRSIAYSFRNGLSAALWNRRKWKCGDIQPLSRFQRKREAPNNDWNGKRAFSTVQSGVSDTLPIPLSILSWLRHWDTQININSTRIKYLKIKKIFFVIYQILTGLKTLGHPSVEVRTGLWLNHWNSIVIKIIFTVLLVSFFA